MMITLINLDIFRDKYGFVAADDVLRAVNLMIHTTVREVGRMTDFVGHLSGDAFLVVTIPATVQDLKNLVTSKLQQSLEYFYPINDRERPQIAQERLRVDIKQLDSSQARFISVEALKKALFESKSI
jgi:GGDEF domain-containing protein